MFPNREHENIIFLFLFSFGSFNFISIFVQISERFSLLLPFSLFYDNKMNESCSPDVYLAGTVMLIFGMGLYGLFISNTPSDVSPSVDRALKGSSLFGMFALKVISYNLRSCIDPTVELS
jgi:hypothetical protein